MFLDDCRFKMRKLTRIPKFGFKKIGAVFAYNSSLILTLFHYFPIYIEMAYQISEKIYIRQYLIFEFHMDSNVMVITKNMRDVLPSASDIRKWKVFFFKFKSSNFDQPFKNIFSWLVKVNGTKSRCSMKIQNAKDNGLFSNILPWSTDELCLLSKKVLLFVWKIAQRLFTEKALFCYHDNISPHCARRTLKNN